MKYPTLWGAILVLALFLTACGSAATPAVATTVAATALTEPAVTESPVATEASVATALPAATTTQATDTATEGVPVTGNETTIKATLSDNYGPILVDSDGRSVYVFTRDTQNGDSSACTDAECTADWEPVTSTGAPVAGAGAIQNLLGTISREDGTMQVTYNGWPLYYFSGDNGAGSTSGQATDNEWFLVSPSGKAIRE